MFWNFDFFVRNKLFLYEYFLLYLCLLSSSNDYFLSRKEAPAVLICIEQIQALESFLEAIKTELKSELLRTKALQF